MSLLTFGAMWKGKGNERKSMEMNHGFPTQRSPEPEVKSKGGVTVEQLITRYRVDCCVGRKWRSLAGSQQGNRTGENMLVLMLRRKVGSKAAGERKRNRPLPTISNRVLQVYFILAPVPETLVIITIGLWVVQKLIIHNRGLRVFDSQKD